MTQRGPSIIARIAIIACLILATSPLFAEQQAEQVNAKQQSESHIEANPKPDAVDQKPKDAVPTPVAPAPIQVLSEVHERKNEKQQNNGEQEGTEFWPVFFGLKLKITDTIIAAFTVLLFAATAALWKATRDLVSGADRNAERQARAYISVMQARVFFAESSLRVIVHAKNYGQTPAYNVSHIYGAEIAILPFEPDFIRTGERPNDKSGSIGPGAEHGFILTLDNIPADRLNAAKRGSLPVIAWGAIWYDDAFGNERRTDFRFVYEGTQTQPPGLMSLSLKGNEET